MISNKLSATVTTLALALSLQTTIALAGGANYQTAQYHENEETTVRCGVGLLCEITFEPGERLRKVVESQRSLWGTEITKSGSNPETPHLYFKPTDKGLRENVAVSSDRREYQLFLVSENSDRRTYMRFLYGDEQRARERHARHVREIADSYRRVHAQKVRKVASSYISAIDQACSSMPQAQWRMDRFPAEFVPRKVCQSKDHTYIAMPIGPTQSDDLPVVNLDTPDGTQYVYSRYDETNRVFVIDGTSANYVLISTSGRHQIRLRIQRHDIQAQPQTQTQVQTHSRRRRHRG
jgi:type IV secretory pathway VirB9-like protein